LIEAGFSTVHWAITRPITLGLHLCHARDHPICLLSGDHSILDGLIEGVGASIAHHTLTQSHHASSISPKP